MNFEKAKVYRYDFQLNRPLILKGEEYHTRSGLILRVGDDELFGLGEIAPLPGFSEETLEQATAQLFEILNEYKSKPLGNIAEVTQNLLPSVAFGIETALISYSANAKQFSFSSLVNRDAKPTVPLNGLLWGENVIERAEQLVQAGYSTLKLKIGQQPLDDDLKLIENLFKIIDRDNLLRLDANRAYDYNSALRLIDYAKAKPIEYIEEPFASLDDLKKYLSSGENPGLIALDESLREVNLSEKIEFKKAGAIVLKPTMTGYLKSMALASQAFHNEQKVIISSSFESALGLYHLASMGAIINSDKFDYAAGLDTYDWFEENLFDFSKYISGGCFNLSHAFECYSQIDWSRLREVEHA